MVVIALNQKKYENLKQKLKYVYAAFGTLVLIVIVTFFLNRSFSELLENDVEVEPNSELTYYLKVTYDGVDRQGVESDDNTTANIRSGSIYVQDKIPEGLTFEGFVTTADGTIGAVERKDGTTACVGKVVDDTNEASLTEGTWNSTNTEYTYHGLHYDAASRMVTFEVKNLQAGCELTVGIKTRTPAKVDDPNTPEKETRRDFYNTGTAREGTLSFDSNTVHAFMGNSNTTLYSVSYAYTGTVPTEAPSVPATRAYAEKAKVGVVPDVMIPGYTFSGWTCAGVTVTNGSFDMPASNVVCTGYFAAEDQYKVTYQINGTKPENYVLPKEKHYYPNNNVIVDSGLKVGDTFQGYRFLGWETTDVTITTDGDFAMPTNNVLLTGNFEEVTYKVTYQFYDTVLPPNAENYLPAEQNYKPGVMVTTQNVTGQPTGYEFLGWYKESSFEMPEEDVVIYGEWKRKNGEFEPTITKSVVNDLGFYRPGQMIQFAVTVTNTASFPIRDVILKEELEGITFEDREGYVIESKHIVRIPTIAAGASQQVLVNYIVTQQDKNKVENTITLIGALADNYYELKEKEYKATASTNVQSRIKVCKSIQGTGPFNTFQIHVEEENRQYETWIALQKDECKNIYVKPASYKITEVLPQEYYISSVTGAITANSSTLVVEQGKDYEITYENQFVRKGFFHSSGRVVNVISQGVVYDV